MSRPAWWVEVTIGQWKYSKVLWVLMFIHMGFCQAICAADLLPGNGPPCWGVEPVRSSGVWPRKQLGYPDEVLPSQCGLDESCHISQCLCVFNCIENTIVKKLQGQLFKIPRLISIFCMTVGGIHLEHMRLNHFPHLWLRSVTYDLPFEELWCIELAQNLHNLEIFRSWLILTLTESLYKVKVRLRSVCRSKLPQTPLKGDVTVTCRFSLGGSWNSDVNLKWLLCFHIYIFYDLFLQGTKFIFFLFWGGTAQAANLWQKCASLWEYYFCADGVLLSGLVHRCRAMITSHWQ